MKIQIKNLSHHPLPQYQTQGAAAFDLAAFLEQPVVLAPAQRVLVPTGLYMAVPIGFELQIRPRSGLAYRQGISVANAPGTVDADYRGEIKVILVNLSAESYTVQDGDRIAQGVLAQCVQAQWEEVSDLDETDRGHGGFGHTGRR